MPKRTKPITDQLRDAIRKAEAGGMTRGEIARGAGISVTGITRILDGGEPKLNTADAIFRSIGYQRGLTAGR